ncbi:MAG: 16S rRNA (adenine(1518)-N(6)/adenine(1519)-N(6))-dimethyltransferase RsmA [Zymomonas mobilis subsp. pomaceae]|uniref:Ribosomal RNA small subunit methyltransferase A n=1 Tax=Zymomonas mobilis subsp. pomaceae (strain ATCC 29192 / DSM 22645 / JCM 10191 / CCUG 17912 / NBRC 13757 / NCIMB 11200 / NRRL B-4491 / Barker I) TaxID=579138 RepID=F8ET40_ZYMMT|nr:16S rRNA (adenine(1518)-N(6)/adenine(1519)-N(6))-dimethyltransferase RsmA [Zymomonas mobilis]AEI36930.1 dimethyladenosine transferase [Zymomonas mobilis subsp. pomaceae ATCC 29192]MDX5948303.1 16S rRNA (adenine(1518)-N(6)/adenine(1519)-N(6))-dimethyltransferase RsmA [Zymomonas mobilis subsp. pomaceae]GEB89057.1 ribosomal RNA small subunit methyltransferase A [Zymomonas mobilis subsp. pomaceae]
MSQTEKLEPLRAVIARYGLAADKRLGQNFLLDSQLLNRIARVPGDLENTSVYEVGPGPGGLTRALLSVGAHVTAVERDRRCLPALEELSLLFPEKLQIISGDAMTVDEAQILGKDIHIVANLPYNVGTALLIRWLTVKTWYPWWRSLTLMFQKEVAERITAKVGSEHYGRLSVLAQWRSQAKLSFTVHRSAFVPPPKVTSAIVHLTPKAQPEQTSLATLEKVTAAAFNQRRKMLRQSLKNTEGAMEALEAIGIESSRRPETLSVEEFVAIARHLDSSAPKAA